jgi:GntR family transcriptional regulator
MTTQNTFSSDNLDKSSPIPMYYQIQKLILEKIEKGIWPPKTQIPPERELAETFQVSRMTMRQALAELTRLGVLTREIGRGTFVSEPRIREGLHSLSGFSSDMVARGKRPGAKVISMTIDTVPPQLALRLQVELSDQVLEVERLRTADGETMSLERSFIHFKNCQALLQEDLSQSLYDLLINKYQIIPTKAHQQISAGLSTQRESDFLEIKLKSPVLRLSRLTVDQYQHPFEFVESVYRADKYIFEADMVLNPQSTQEK